MADPVVFNEEMFQETIKQVEDTIGEKLTSFQIDMARSVMGMRKPLPPLFVGRKGYPRHFAGLRKSR